MAYTPAEIKRRIASRRKIAKQRGSSTASDLIGNDINTAIDEILDAMANPTVVSDFVDITVSNNATITNVISDGESTFASIEVVDQAVTHNFSLPTKGNITQSGSISTTVTLPTPVDYNSGVIITVSSTIAAGGASATFNVGSTLLYSSSRTPVFSLSYSGAGTPVMTWARTLPDVVAIKITNLHPSDALDNVIRIYYHCF